MDEIKEFPKFVKFFFYEHDISETKLKLNKSQTTVLMLVHEHRNKQTMSRISREIGLEKSSFTRCVDQLEKEGFLERKPSQEDKRSINLSFTKKGDRAVELIKADWQHRYRSLLSVLDAREQAELSKALATVSRHLNKIMAPYPAAMNDKDLA